MSALGAGRKYVHDLGSVVYGLRKRRGLSQTVAASEIGVSMHTVHRVESQGTIPNRLQYSRMAACIRRQKRIYGLD
ncbi:helix-turn-helix domain-containing protein [bacterium]|nr:helix-turn-helix domain-containing protein [bacterium]